MNQQNNYQPAVQQPNLLVFGILSLVLGPLFAIIFGAIGRSKGKAFIREGGTLTGGSKVGYILSLVGLIIGIIAMVVIVIMAIVLIAGGASLSTYSY